MSPQVLVSWPGQEHSRETHPLRSLPELLKAHPAGLFRAPYFIPDGTDEAGAQTGFDAGSLPLEGPFLISHSIRRAADLLLEDCSYEGLTFGLEVDGKRLPELPSHAELQSLLERENTLVIVDQRSFRPGADVFGFDQVYNDAVKFIDGLKTLGITADAMAIYATPDEIAIEVHPGVFGSAGDPSLARRHALVLMHLAGIRRNRGRLQKTWNRTVRLETTSLRGAVLVPGTNHPTLHRPKVGVGPSHFAYGPAAFSDFCGKKRPIDDCLKELRVWLKFLETPRDPLPAIASLVERLEGEIPVESEAHPTATPPGRENTGGGLVPLAQDLRRPEAHLLVPGTLPTPWSEMNKALAGGFAPRGLHLITGNREEGKASFLLSLALAAAAKRTVLFLSREQTLPEITGRLLAHLRKTPATDWAPRTMVPGVEGEATRKKVQDAIGDLARSISPNLYFRGSDSSLRLFDLDELGELVKMLPGGSANEPVVVLFEGFHPAEATPDFIRRLRTASVSRNWTTIFGLHTALPPLARPQFIEGSDLEVLAGYHGAADTILQLQSEKINLKKFLAMAQGKVDPALVEKLEAKFTQSAGGDRRRQDTFTLARLLHSRWGNRSAILYLFQREYGLFWEGPAMPLGRP